jgi:hypothetical protein
MSKMYLSAVFVLLTYTGFGQKIHFTDSTNTWKISASGKDDFGYPFSASYHYYYSGDTTISGVHYKRLAGYSILLNGYNSYPRPDIYFVREDTVAGKVWCRTSGHGPAPDTSEKLIYDDSWALNDTVFSEPGQATYYINDIDSTQINGAWHRVFGIRMLATPQPQNYFFVVEGLGSNIGPGYAFTGGFSLERDYRLNCFHNRGAQPALIPALGSTQGMGAFSNTDPCDLKVDGDDAMVATMLWPNPVNQSSRIVFSRAMERGELMVYDCLGKMVTKQAMGHSTSLLLHGGAYAPGLYYYRVTDLQSGAVASGSFVRQ